MKKDYYRIKTRRILALSLYCICLILLSACGSSPVNSPAGEPAAPVTQPADTPSDETAAAEDPKGTRDNTPKCLVPEAPGTATYGNDVVSIDASNINTGYLCVSYLGTNSKVKLQITGPDRPDLTIDVRMGFQLIYLQIVIYKF